MTSQRLIIDVVVSEMFQENAFIAGLEGRSDCVVIDPGFDGDRILALLDKRQLVPAAILNTHGHADHIAGNAALKDRWPGCPLVIGTYDAAKLTDPMGNLSGLYGFGMTSPPADELVEDGRVYPAAGLELHVRAVPGHSRGHVVYLWKGGSPWVVFGGDVLFRGSVGRADFPDSQPAVLIQSIRTQLYSLPDDTVVYPGHGEETTIGEEKRYNPYVRGGDRVEAPGDRLMPSRICGRWRPGPNLLRLDAADPGYATRFVDVLLAAGAELGASDIHLQPTGGGLEVRWRLDGVLQRVGLFPPGEAADVIARLKVLAELLTYRTDVPQEGRVRRAANGVEMRVSTFPTLHGERAVVRIFAGGGGFMYLEDLGLPADVLGMLRELLAETAGAILLSGPAGSGKTTTGYAALRELVRTVRGERSIVSLEDPVEVAVDGVAQSQVHAAAGFDFPTGLRSLMRQDPEVIFVGEIRDRVTAETAFQAALTGHLVLTTFHAGSAAGAVSRLSDMGLEPYLLRSGLLGIVCQRLVRRLCACARPAREAAEKLGLPVQQARVAVGCPECQATGYRGRLVLVELLTTRPSELGHAILERRDAATLDRLAGQAGMVSRWTRAVEAVEAGWTAPAEIRRVLGFSETWSA